LKEQILKILDAKFGSSVVIVVRRQILKQ